MSYLAVHKSVLLMSHPELFESSTNGHEISSDIYSLVSKALLVHSPTEFVQKHKFDEKDTVIPVRSFVSIRTIYSNKVVVGNHSEFAFDCTQQFGHNARISLNDALMLSGKELFERVFDCDSHMQQLLFKTQFCPLGAMYCDGEIVVYSHIILEDSAQSLSFFKLHSGYSLSLIETLEKYVKTHRDAALFKKMIIVKGGDSIEHL